MDFFPGKILKNPQAIPDIKKKSPILAPFTS